MSDAEKIAAVLAYADELDDRRYEVDGHDVAATLRSIVEDNHG